MDTKVISVAELPPNNDCAYRKSHLRPETAEYNVCKSKFRPRLGRTNGGVRKIHTVCGEQENSCLSAARIGTALRLVERRRDCYVQAALVAVMKTANLRDRNDGSDFQRVHGTRFWRVLGQREVRPGFVIVRQE